MYLTKQQLCERLRQEEIPDQEIQDQYDLPSEFPLESSGHVFDLSQEADAGE